MFSNLLSNGLTGFHRRPILHGQTKVLKFDPSLQENPPSCLTPAAEIEIRQLHFWSHFASLYHRIQMGISNSRLIIWQFLSLIFAAYLVRCTLLKQGDEPKEKTFWMVIVRPGVIARGSSLINWKSILNIFSSNWTNCWLQILLAEYFHLVVSSFLDFRIPGSFFPEVWEDSPKIWKLLLEFPVSGSWLKVP